MTVDENRRHSDSLRGIDRFAAEVASDSTRRTFQGRFGMMFACLEPFSPPQHLIEMLAARMTASEETPDSVSLPSGYTILGQFITHDLTFDNTPLEAQEDDPLALENFRTARFDLDSVYAKTTTYGEPPRDPLDRAKMAYFRDVTTVHKIDDLPRDPSPGKEHGFAFIADRRNDENKLLAQLHLAFLKLHNVFVDQIDGAKTRPREPVFDEARERCRWYFQWLVVNDFLPRIVGKPMVDKILKIEGGVAHFDLKLYKPLDTENPFMPVEFATAAFRFGHSMVRPIYLVHDNEGVVLFDDESIPTLVGFEPIDEVIYKVEWARFFFELPGMTPDQRNHALRIDSHLTSSLGRIPEALLPRTETSPKVRNLAQRDLTRGVLHGLPAGQCVARAVLDAVGEDDIQIIPNEDLGLTEAGWNGRAPLWFYLLKEAERTSTTLDDGSIVTGERLGPVGGRIVAEVILGLLKHDANSYLRKAPSFMPKPIGSAPLADTFKMADLMQLAGVAP